MDDIDVAFEVEKAIKRWAKKDKRLDWPGSKEVKRHAAEIAGFLYEEGLLRPGDNRG